MKKFVITGGGGFIGSCLAKRLIQEGHKVCILDDLSTGFKHNIPEGSVFHQVSVSDSRALAALQIPGSVDTVFHLAAQSSGEASFADPGHDIDVNYKATFNILDWCRTRNIKRFIFASSMSVYGDKKPGSEKVSELAECSPASYYGCNKLASEKMIEVFSRQAGIQSTLLRFFNVYGPGQNMKNLKQGMVSIYMAYLMKNEPVTVKGSLDRFRDFIYIEDLLDLLTLIEKSQATHQQVFNVGTGVKTTVRDLLQALLKAYGKKEFNAWVKQDSNTPGDIQGVVADVSKLQEALDWQPRYGLEEGVRRMKEWADATSDLWN